MIDPQLHNKFRELYNPEGSKLRILQNDLLEILILIHKICVKHRLTYWISSGTVLGAVRHGGFIPWDDDIDIEMPYSDYLKFIKICKKEISFPFVIQTHNTDSNYYQEFAKIRNENIKISERHKEDKYFKYKGIFIDIFPVVNGFPILFQKIGGKWLYTCRQISVKNNKLIRNIDKLILYPLGKYLLKPFIMLLSIRRKNEYSMNFGMGAWNKRMKKDILPTSLITFEGHEFYGPNNPDNYLRNIYGDYKNPIIMKSHLTSIEV